jgi:flagellar biosynthetic protein FliQ
MNELEALDLGREAIIVMLKISGPVLAVGLVVGVIVALFQALTSLQEMTLTFVPKIVVMFLSIVFLLPYIYTTLSGFTLTLFDRMQGLG